MDGSMDGLTDRPELIGPFLCQAERGGGSNKST